MNELTCHEHSGICARIHALEEDMKETTVTLRNIQKILIGTLITLIFNLIGVITVIVMA